MTDLFTDTPDDNVSYYEALVGEGKKFRDNEALAKAKAHSDRHVAALEAETQALRKQISEKAAMEELLTRIESKIPTVLNTPNDNGSNLATPPVYKEAPASSNTNSKSLTLDDVSSLVQESLSKEKQRQSQEQNFRFVQEELVKAYGPGYQAVLSDKIEKAGLTKEQANTLATTTPRAFLMMISSGQAQRPVDVAPPRSNMNSNANVTPGGNARNHSYYKEMKKNNPKLYWRADTQVQREKDALSMGDEFFK